MKKIFGLVTNINLILIIIALNVVAAFLPTIKLDLTKNKIHTLSSASATMLKKLDDIVRVKVYLSNDLPPEAKPVAANLKTVLAEMAAVNNRKFVVSYADPNKDSNAKSEVEKYGINPLQFSSIKSDKVEVSNGYFGLVLLYGDKREILPVAGDIGNLEYFLTSSIKKLTTKKLPVVGMVQGQGETDKSEIQYFEKFLSQQYEIVDVNLSQDSQINQDIKSLIVIGPKEKFDDKSLNKIKDYLKNKDKSIILFLDRAEISSNLAARNLNDLGLESWLKEEGIEIENKLVLDQSSSLANFRTKEGTYFTQYPFWIEVRPENINRNLPVTSNINNLTLFWASPIKISNDKIVKLAESSSQSWLSDNFTDLTPSTKNISPGQMMGKQVLAALKTEGQKIAVVTSSNFIKDAFVTNNQQNLAFGLNLVDFLALDSSLIEIRSKAIYNPPLLPLSTQLKEAVRWTNIILPLALIVFLAVLVNFQRKRINRKWMK